MGLSSQWKAWLLAGATLAAGLGVAAVIYTGQRGAGPVVEREPTAAPATPAAPAPQASAAADPEAEQEPQAQPLVAPAFDVVRVAEDGGALVAGSALAGAAVVLRVDGAVVAETSADNAGQFVLLFSLPPSDAAQIMTLEMVLADGRALSSDDRVVLAPRPGLVAAMADDAPDVVAGRVAPESVELALLQPETSDLSDGEITEPARMTAPPAQAPGHEVAARALGQALPQPDDIEDAPVITRDIPPAPVEDAQEVTAAGTLGRDAGPVTEPATGIAEPRSEATAEAAAQAAAETRGETAVELAAELAPEPTAGTESAAETAIGTGTATGTEAIPETAQAPDQPTVTTEPDSEVMQASVHVPNEIPVPASAPEASETAPDPLPEAPEPGHQAAATALEIAAAPLDAGSEAAVTVGDAPAPATGPVAPVSDTPAPMATAPLPDGTVPGDGVPSSAGTEETVGMARIEAQDEASETAESSDAAQIGETTATHEATEFSEASEVTETSEATETSDVAETAQITETSTENLVPRAFMLRGSGEVTLLDRAPQVMDNIVIDLISYSDSGAVQISGRAASGGGGARVQIYLDNRPIAIALAENGDWTSDLPSVDPGVYTLRVDQLDDEDRVVSRFETPFQREDPAYVRAARAESAAEEAARMARAGDAGTTGATDAGETGTDLTEARATENATTERSATAPRTAAEADTQSASPTITISGAPATATDPVGPAGHPSVALMTVQPGHSLWRISEGHYGAGHRYLLIYNANRSQIRNPDLIYPGQIFKLPE